MSTVPPRTPVLVGVGTVSQREDDFARAQEPVALMVESLERAAADAGAPALLSGADSIRAPRGFWDYPDPCRIVAERLGAARARMEVAEVGVLQTTLLARAADDIASGRADVVLVTGGEARYRALRARLVGGDAPRTRQRPDVTPDSVLRPAGEILDPVEMRHGFVMPVGQYAMIENALRAADGLGIDTHRRALAGLVAAASRVAAGNPDAWTREPVGIEDVLRARPLAFPYTRLHTSEWNVDQAAGLILCSAERARALGVPRARWVFPLAVAESNHMLPVSRRRHLHRSPGFALAGARLRERLGRGAADVAHVELYSCFPAAVRVQARELGLDEKRPLTLTGGMAFAGGPLNSFVLQALPVMARRLRDDPGSVGLLTAVSGMITKQGVSAWSTEPPAGGFHSDDVSAEAARHTAAVEVVPGASGRATVASYTVLHEGAAPPRAILLCELEDGRRTLCESPDPALVESLEREEWCGRPVRITTNGDVAT
ncbi:MAG TPA: acetyl-CoA acetyltransferase [Candidatus Binatia bacterium]|nr:acetyl-CoA acetyltransferase [Candidatus Binatia bacterium]